MKERRGPPLSHDQHPFDPDPQWGPDDDPTRAGGAIAGKKTYRYVELPNVAGLDLRVKLPKQTFVVEVHHPDNTISYEIYDPSKHGELADLQQTPKKGFQPEFGDEQPYRKSWE